MSSKMEFIEKRNEYIIEMSELRTKIVLSSINIHNVKFDNKSLYYLSLFDKSTKIIDGFMDSLNSRNLTCMGIFLRVILDNCMKTYAGLIVADKELFFDNFIEPKIIVNNMKDIHGKRINDANLRKRLSSFDEYFDQNYKNSSGDIHFSSNAFLSIVDLNSVENIKLKIGAELGEHLNDIILKCTKSFVYFLELQIILNNIVIEEYFTNMEQLS